MEVRCCSDARKLLGYLPDPMNGATSMRFISGNEILEFEVGVMSNSPDIRGHLAYKSKNYPMEKLRKIKEFVEAL